MPGGKFVSGSGRSKVTTIPTKKGYTTYKHGDRTYSGSGTKPAGATVVPTPPTTIITKDDGTVVSAVAGKTTKQALARDRKVQRRIEKQKRQRQRFRKEAYLVKNKPKKKRPAPKRPAVSKPTAAPKAFHGKPTLGAPTRKSLSNASRAGTLRSNKQGYLVTPEVRSARKELKQARVAAKKAAPKLRGPLTAGQKTFVKKLSKETGLAPRVLAAQALAEQSGSAAQQREAEGNHNWLNVGYFDSGPGGLTQDTTWRNPKTAAKATAQFLKGRKYGASSGIQNILSSRGKPDKAQIAAIASSGWATNPAYQQSLEGTHALVSTKPGSPKATKRLRAAQSEAEALGLPTKGKAPEVPQNVPKKVLTRFKAAQSAAKELERAKLPYVWGGGHGDPASRPTGGGLDCSGAVSYVLNKMGAMKGSLVSGDMGSVLKPGPGAVTVFYNPGHTFMRIGNRYFGTSSSNDAGGPGFIEGTPDDLSQYSVGHVPGMGKKVAVQMGIPLTSGGTPSFPGMSLSSSGTTATITEGVTKAKPGTSQKPIKLTPMQKYRRTARKLASLDVGASTSESKVEPVTLKSLEERYNVRT